MSAENVHILLFHRVSPVRDPLWDPMDPALFREVLQYVDKKFTVLGLQEYFFRERVKFKKPPAIITFDDGYHDFIEYSAPIMQEFKMPSTLFVVTGCIDENKPTWTYLFDHVFYNTKKLRTTTPPLVPGFTMRNEWKTKSEQLEYGSQLKQFLKKVPHDVRMAVVNFYQDELDVQMEDKVMLSWDELNQLQQSNVEIGSHTITHPPLATLTDERVIEEELHGSGMRIKDKLGAFPASVSYPVGSYNNKVKNMAHRLGYKIGMAVDQKIYNEDRYGRFSVPRLELYNESFFKTKLRINGTISRVKQLIRK